MVQWGAFTSGHSNEFRVGIQWIVNKYGNGRIDAWVDSQYSSVDDDQTLAIAGPDVDNKSISFHNSGGAIQVGSANINGELGTDIDVTLSLSGVYNGAAPSTTFTYHVDALPPDPPPPPTYTSISASDVTVNWQTPNTNGAPIDLYQLDFDDGLSPERPTHSGSKSYDRNGLDPNTRYGVQVRARNSAGWSAYSDTSYFRTLYDNPAAPTGVHVIWKTATSANIGWNTGYTGGGSIVDAQVDFDPPSSQGRPTAGDGNTHEIWGGLSPNTAYDVQVRVKNSGGLWSAWSSEVAFVTDPEPAAPPTGFTATRVSDTTQTLTWTNNATADAPYDHLEIDRRAAVGTSGVGAWQHLANVGGGQQSYTDDSTAANARYYWRIRAVNAQGATSWVTGADISTTPAAPTGVSASKATGDLDDILVEFTRQATYVGVDDTQVQDNPDGTGWVDVGTVYADGTEFRHQSVNLNVTHRYRVRAVSTDPTLYSAWSDPSNVVQLLAPPNAPTLVSPQGVIPRDAPVVFVWQHNPVDTTGQTAFELRYRIDGGTWTTVSGTTAETYTLPAIGTTSTVEWQVRTQGAYSGTSPWSPWAAVATFQTASVPVATIQNSAVPFPRAYLDLHWAYQNADGGPQAAWQAELLNATGQVIESDGGSTAVSDYTFDTVLDNNTDYSVRLRVRAPSGLWSAWALWDFHTEFPLPAEVIPRLEWNRDPGSVGLSFQVPQEWATYTWTGTPHQSTSTRTTASGTVTNLVTNPRGRDTSGTVTLRENLVPNPSFEYGTAGWNPDASVTLSRASDTAAGVEGSYVGSVKPASPGSVLNSRPMIQTPAGTIPAAPGDVVSVMGRCRRAAFDVPTQMRLLVLWYGDAGFNGSEVVGVVSTAAGRPASMNEVSLEGITVPAGTTDMRLAWYAMSEEDTSTWVDGALYVDAHMIARGATLPPYADGDSTSADSDLTWEWSGTPGESTSVLTAPNPVGYDSYPPDGTVYYSARHDAIAVTGQGDVAGRFFASAQASDVATLVVDVTSEDPAIAAWALSGAVSNQNTTGPDTPISPGSWTTLRTAVQFSGGAYGAWVWNRGALTTLYFRMAIIEGTDSYTGPWFDGDVQSTTAVDSVDVQRRWNDGEWTTIATGLNPDTSITDTAPPVSGTVCWRVISRTDLPTAYKGTPRCFFFYPATQACPDLSTLGPHVVRTIQVGSAWINGGANYSRYGRALLELLINDPGVGRAERVLHRFSQRDYPVAYDGTALTWEVDLSFAITPSGDTQHGHVSTFEEWVQIAQLTGPMVYRDYQGRWWQCTIGQPAFKQAAVWAGVQQVSLKVTRVDREPDSRVESA